GYNGHKAYSAGTESNARVKVTPGLLGWADIIFCMEKKHMRRIKEKYPDAVAEKKLVCLNISDDYEYMDNELRELLEACVREYI
ncbi:MAG: protein tyrosine phosphatase, partial [Oscillospiraceae bacterium]|nr:protein tyrosine phosphatase [Oscillospiraceae bacterium]